jgi:hypothetical protein
MKAEQQMQVFDSVPRTYNTFKPAHRVQFLIITGFVIYPEAWFGEQLKTNGGVNWFQTQLLLLIHQ